MTTTSQTTTPVPARDRALALWHRFVRTPEAGAILSLLAVSVILALLSSQFLTAGNLTLVARGFAFTAIAAMGGFLVILTGGIDLSVGSVMGLAGLTAAATSVAGAHPIAALLAALLVGSAVGLINGAFTSYLGLAPFMVTLGMLSVVRGTNIWITGGTPIQGIDPAITWLGQGYLIGIPVPVWIMLIIGVLLTIIMKRTSFGWAVYSIGGNEESARLSGVKVRQTKALVYTIAGLLGAIGGLLLTARLGVGESTSGTGYELDVIAAAVIGGTSLQGGRGSVAGAIWGAALLGVVRNGLVLLGVSDFWQTISIGLVIIFAVLIDRYRTRNSQ